jgi:ABC-type multidrug transport system ATPase subunit
MLKALIGELRGAGRSVVLSTHDLEIACRVADDIVVLDRGRIAWQGDAEVERSARPLPIALRERLAATSPAPAAALR